MRGARAKALRKAVYGEESFRVRRYARRRSGQVVCASPLRLMYQALKKARHVPKVPGPGN